MKYKCFIGILLTLILMISCNKNDELNENFGTEIIQTIKNAKEIHVYKVNSSFHDEYEIKEEIKNLNLDEINKIKNLLLDKKNYIFNVDKRCLFLPEYMLVFDQSEQAQLLLNVSGKQISFPKSNLQKKYNIDPINFEIIKIIHSR